MRKKGTARRRVKIVRERRKDDTLDMMEKMIASKVEPLALEFDRLRDANVQLRMLIDLAIRRVNGLEARMDLDRLRENVKW